MHSATMRTFSAHSSPFTSPLGAVRSPMVIVVMLILLPLAVIDAGADQQHTSLLAPVASSDAFDVFMDILEDTNSETHSKKTKSSEFAVCKAVTKCASVHLPCPATCVEGFYGGGGGGGFMASKTACSYDCHSSCKATCN
ncbi:hypothetical protein KP509_13G058600 [Ceratopteris richardii]|uniref:Uncharacterized protein n=1 Tax=Ceratopteris richardii TaxID=49495 RepID=A0A8T2THZ2_CERRI|nr:hypothetical protein KP509_13G058600 [Ceratopteris richardii]